MARPVVPSDDPAVHRSYRIGDDPSEIRLEDDRLKTLAERSDGWTRRLLTQLGIGGGWRCLDVGTGAGTVATWMGEQVAPDGQVLAVDVDTRFAPRSSAGIEFRQLDVTTDPLPAGAFELVHARAVLEHLESRDEVLDAMVAALVPGGWIVVADGDWSPFDSQDLPEPFASLHWAVRRRAVSEQGFDPYLGRRLLAALVARGLEDARCEGRTYTMQGGTSSAEWYVGALERTVIAEGPLDEGAAAALAQARRRTFRVLSPTSFTAWARKPASS